MKEFTWEVKILGQSCKCSVSPRDGCRVSLVLPFLSRGYLWSERIRPAKWEDARGWLKLFADQACLKSIEDFLEPEWNKLAVEMVASARVGDGYGTYPVYLIKTREGKPKISRYKHRHKPMKVDGLVDLLGSGKPVGRFTVSEIVNQEAWTLWAAKKKIGG